MFIDNTYSAVEFELLLMKLSARYFLLQNYLMHLHTDTIWTKPPVGSLSSILCQRKKLPHFIHKVHITKTNEQHCKYRVVVTEMRSVLGPEEVANTVATKTNLKPIYKWWSWMTLPYKRRVASCCLFQTLFGHNEPRSETHDFSFLQLRLIFL